MIQGYPLISNLQEKYLKKWQTTFFMRRFELQGGADIYMTYIYRFSANRPSTSYIYRVHIYIGFPPKIFAPAARYTNYTRAMPAGAWMHRRQALRVSTIRSLPHGSLKNHRLEKNNFGPLVKSNRYFFILPKRILYRFN